MIQEVAGTKVPKRECKRQDGLIGSCISKEVIEKGIHEFLRMHDYKDMV